MFENAKKESVHGKDELMFLNSQLNGEYLRRGDRTWQKYATLTTESRAIYIYMFSNYKNSPEVTKEVGKLQCELDNLQSARKVRQLSFEEQKLRSLRGHTAQRLCYCSDCTVLLSCVNFSARSRF